jgi:hypothetical protein
VHARYRSERTNGVGPGRSGHGDRSVVPLDSVLRYGLYDAPSKSHPQGILRAGRC